MFLARARALFGNVIQKIWPDAVLQTEVTVLLPPDIHQVHLSSPADREPYHKVRYLFGPAGTNPEGHLARQQVPFENHAEYEASISHPRSSPPETPCCL